MASIFPALCCSAVLPAVLVASGVTSGSVAAMQLLAPNATVIRLASLGLLLARAGGAFDAW